MYSNILKDETSTESPIHKDLELIVEQTERCKKIVDRVDMRKKPDKAARIAALKRAWDGQAFSCYYSGISLDEIDCRNPRYLTFDHRIPRKEDDLVVASA